MKNQLGAVLQKRTTTSRLSSLHTRHIFANRQQGNATIFPGWMPHMGLPGTKGQRFGYLG
jgi:hypothetical protein